LGYTQPRGRTRRQKKKKNNNNEIWVLPNQEEEEDDDLGPTIFKKSKIKKGQVAHISFGI
jgi:hypothetical protein